MKPPYLFAPLFMALSMMVPAANTYITDSTNLNDANVSNQPKTTGCVQLPLTATTTDIAVPPPSYLTAQAVDSQVILHWISTTDTHRIHYGTASFAEITEDNYAPWGASHYRSKCVPKGNQATIDNLHNGIRYYFVVTGIRNNIQSPPSNEISAMPLAFNG